MPPKPPRPKEAQPGATGKEPSRSVHARKEQLPTYVLRRDLKEIRESRGLRVDDVIEQAGIAKNTLLNAEAGRPVGAETAQRLAKFFRLEFWAVVDQAILPPAQPKGILCWLVGEMGPVLTTSNGIQWRICDLTHLFAKNLKRRGKLYDLSHFSHNQQVWQNMQTYLSRHTEVCNRVGDHPNIARSYDVFCEDQNRAVWWVIDEWIDGMTLEDRVAKTSLEDWELALYMRDVAAGLQQLHRVGVIRRELSPRFIYVSKERAVLTDFELAKLLDASPTVRPRTNWPDEDEPYRAPEVRSIDELDSSCDFYSWAMVLAFAATSKKSAGSAEASGRLRDSSLPRDVRDFALSCLGPKSRRPKDFQPVQKWFDSARMEAWTNKRT